jgi:ATP synthase F1 delta subunit
VNASLQGYAASVLGTLSAADLEATARDLAMIDETMQANRDLRAAMTDTSITGIARRDVLTAVLAAKVAPAASRLAGYAALVNSAQDVPASISYLAQRSRDEVRDGAYDEVPLSVLGARERVGGYAAAVFENLSTSDLERVESELFAVARAIESAPELRRAMTDRDLPTARRAGIVESLVGAKASEASRQLLGYAVAGGRARDVVGTIDWLVDQAATARGWRVAKVATAKALDASQADRLRTSLAAVTGSPVELQVTEDAGLLGGIRVEVGDLFVDASARGRLDQLREHLEAEHRTFQKND